jgi:signal peptidase
MFGRSIDLSERRLPLKAVAKGIATAALIIVTVLALGIVLAPHFGWRVDKVLSGSMEPALKVGGAAITQPAEPEKIGEGDIITYRSPTQPDLIVCHRVVEVIEVGTPAFKTQGDANEEADPYVVPAQSLEGKVVFHIPLLGYFAGFARTQMGFVVLLLIPGLVLIAGEIRTIWIELSKMEKEKEEREAATQTVVPAAAPASGNQRINMPIGATTAKKEKWNVWSAMAEVAERQKMTGDPQDRTH